MKILSIVPATLTLVFMLALAPVYAAAAKDKVRTVADINVNMAKLTGQTVSAKGKVVKVNNGIMKRNFLHIQDGTGDATTNNLVVTSKQTAKVGDQISITGVVALNRDFGSGYSYPILIEDASIKVKK